jgi:Transposase IS116/IS110/IS902 family
VLAAESHCTDLLPQRCWASSRCPNLQVSWIRLEVPLEHRRFCSAAFANFAIPARFSFRRFRTFSWRFDSQIDSQTTKLVRKHRLDAFGGDPRCLDSNVCVGVRGYVNLAVTDDLHHDSEVNALGEHKRGGGVSEVVEDVADQIRHLARSHYEPLTKLCGVNLLTARILAGMLGPGRRFETEAQLAAYAGTSPLEASSSGVVRHRLNRGGNRRLNSVVYRIALTQAHFLPKHGPTSSAASPRARLAGSLIAARKSRLDLEPTLSSSYSS